MAGIQFGGLASGIDTNAILDQLMAIERAPRTKITINQARTQARETGLKDLTTKLTALQTAATALASPLTWNPVQSVDSADTTKATARQTAGAGPGSYQLAVTQLATSDQHTFTFTQQAAASSLTVGSRTVSLAANATVDDAVSAINADSTVGAFAVNVNGALVLAAKNTGTTGAFTASGSALAEQVAKARPAQDANYTIDGGAVQTSSSNVVANGIPGVELTLKGVTAGTTITVGNPGVDKATITSKVKSFVDAYNAAMDYMRTESAEKPVAKATSNLDAGKGALYGDPTLGAISDKLRGALSTVFDTIGNPTSMNMLSQIGISTGATTGGSTFSADAVAGKLSLDADKLSAALDKDPSSVQRLLGAATGTRGFAQVIGDAITPYTQTAGILDAKVTSADDSLRSLADQLTAFDDKMTLRQDFLRKQFAAMEQALQSLNSQGSQLAARLGLNQTQSY